jgi:hypothetical protein
MAASPQSCVLQFALGPAASLADLRVVANGQQVRLTSHTGTTRSALGSQGTLWGKIDLSKLTHFATVALPSERGLLLSVCGTRRGQTVVLAQAFHAPEQATRTLVEAAFKREASYRSVAGCPDRLAALSLDVSRLTSVDEIVDLDRVFDTYQTAIALTMLHPNVATVAPTEVSTTKSLLGQTPEVCTLGSYIDQMQNQGQDFATSVPAVDANGQPVEITVKGQTTTFSTNQLNQTDPNFTATARSAFIAGIQGVRNTGKLGKVINQPLDEIQDKQDTSTWHEPEGIVIAATPYTPPSGVGAGVQVQVENPGLLYGTYTVLNGAYSGGQLPLKLYNNYVRWVWVYVQYLKADGTNLSLSTAPTWPDTKYAKSLGLLPQIFTVLGIPLWDTNTIEVTLDFPAEATSARLLFCGLGNDLVGGGWRQYFPADAYPDHIAPQDEVLFASLMTGILTIGLTAFALLTDLDIATTWAALKGITEDNIEAMEGALVSLLQSGPILTAAESFATLVAAGGATYEDIAANNGSTANIWNILLSLGSVIPKVIFNPGANVLWVEVAAVIVGEETFDKLIEAIPLIGEIIGVIEAVGDLATLAEAIGETAASPWVIENQISLTYQATVTVSRDPRSPTWPPTARSWRIESTIDGAGALAPITGTFNDTGTDFKPIILQQLTAPFGGQTIKWSIVVLDAAGNQVGAGAAQLTNNDPANPPSTVNFAITELPAVITASTVFKRSATTAWSDSPTASYIWSDAITDTGTLANPGVQEVTGVTISTRLGVAGIVWKQNDQYWLRGVPVAGTTISLGSATRQGYARRPFLLFDSFVGAGDIGNHVLLEPDDTDHGYHIRRLIIAPDTGVLSWDPTRSLGRFRLPVSAAALHSSGRVVAVHTDSGRLGQVLPAATPLPPLASYTAGPGDETGLLRSPTAMAITNPGIVIVLEAGRARLSAFDLNLHPVRYFGTGSPRSFRLALPSSLTYLDIAVDGAGQIYVLSYSNDGSQPGDYRIDVYTPTGAPLATNSPGTNVPHLAVDYFRSIYAANYSALLDIGTTQPHIDPAIGVAEPSLSRFDPS